MAESSGISWCDATMNPWIGCAKVSPACAHCYAETLAVSRMGLTEAKGTAVWGENAARRVTADATWKKPARWNRLALEGLLPDGSENSDGHRPRVFCASMADVFEPRPDLEEPRRRLFDLIEATPELDWLLLTKRPDVARAWLFDFYARHDPREWTSRDGLGWGVLPNVWIGASVENQAWTWRADLLRQIPATVRFVSAEPLLGSLYETAPTRPSRRAGAAQLAALVDGMTDASEGVSRETGRARAPLDLTGIDWLIVGGESGGRASRPMRVEWARELRDACLCDRCGSEGTIGVRGTSLNPWSGIRVPDPQEDRDEVCPDCHGTGRRDESPAFHFKQWGSYGPDGVYRGPQPKANGKLLDGVEFCEFPATDLVAA